MWGSGRQRSKSGGVSLEDATGFGLTEFGCGRATGAFDATEPHVVVLRGSGPSSPKLRSGPPARARVRPWIADTMAALDCCEAPAAAVRAGGAPRRTGAAAMAAALSWGVWRPPAALAIPAAGDAAGGQGAAPAPPSRAPLGASAAGAVRCGRAVLSGPPPPTPGGRIRSRPGHPAPPHRRLHRSSSKDRAAARGGAEARECERKSGG